MAKFNLKKIMDDHVKPIANGIPLAGAAYNTLMGFIGNAINIDIELPVPNIGLPGGGSVSPPPLPPLPPLPTLPANPIDPAKALKEIAKAIKEAETTLLGENLAIHNASVDIDLLVDVGGVAGASAKFNLKIGPVATD